jgi:hypothetical protein
MTWAGKEREGSDTETLNSLERIYDELETSRPPIQSMLAGLFKHNMAFEDLRRGIQLLSTAFFEVSVKCQK